MLLTTQRYDVRSVAAQQDRVAVEAAWSGTLSVTFDGLAEGDTMRARFAMFFEMIDGRIKVQRNYDCFEPAVSTDVQDATEYATSPYCGRVRRK